jgi:hypothetical protein
MKKIFFLLLFLSLSPSSLAIINLQGTFGFGFSNADLKETLAGQAFDHNIDNISLALGAKAGLHILGLEFGALGEASTQYMNGMRNDNKGSFFFFENEGYDNEMQGLLYGYYVGFRLPSKLVLWGEYIPYARYRFSHIENKDGNPFNHNDSLEGDGFSAGIGFRENGIQLSFIMRFLEFDQLKRDGVSTNLPSTSFTTTIEEKVYMLQASFGLGSGFKK